MEITLEEFNDLKTQEIELGVKLDIDAIDEQEYKKEINKLKEKIDSASNLKKFTSKKKFIEYVKVNMRDYEKELEGIEHEAYHAEAMKTHGINFYFCILIEKNKPIPLVKVEPNQPKIKKMDPLKRTIFNIEVITAPYDLKSHDIHDLNLLVNKIKRYKKFTPQQKELLIDMANKLANKEKPSR